jgi:glyoxylase-like metal-dependent hydrolase (beta-lactamase superfamily II)
MDEGEAVAGIDVIHVPGHCPGQVCLRVDDILLTADHILSRITPHQAPESITLNTGLGHYLQSLHKIGRLDGVRLGLGGHELPIADIYQRINDIQAFHEMRLDKR